MLNPDVAGGRVSYAVPFSRNYIAYGIPFPPDGRQTSCVDHESEADIARRTDVAYLTTHY